MRRLALLLAGIVAFCALVTWGLVNDEEPEKPTEADKIIEFCSKPDNADAPLCTVDPGDSNAVEQVIEDAIERQTTGPQIIDRERTIERVEDDDDDPPRVRTVTPRPSPAPTRQAPRTPAPSPTTRPPLSPDIEIPNVPDVPEIPDVGLPLLP